MQRALIAGIFLGALFAYLGVFVVMRRMAFFSDGIAHSSMAGVAAGVLLSMNPLYTALIAGIFFAVMMFFLEKKTNISSDAAIGLIFTFGMALGVLLISLKKGYQPELLGFLFGNILLIKTMDLWLIGSASVIILTFLFFLRREITLISVDPEMAHLSGIKNDFIELAMHVILAVSIILGIKILGIVLVSALLIIPVSISKLISRSFKRLVVGSVIFAEVIVISGILLSYLFDLPTGAVIVLTGAVLFFTVFLLKKT